MSDRSWFEIHCKPEHVDRLKAALEVDFEYADEDASKAPCRLVCFETCLDEDELYRLAAEGIPFYGQHGACQGAYESLLFAAWNGGYASCMACDDGLPIVCIDRATRDPNAAQLASARMYWEVMARAEAEILGGTI